MNKFGIVLGAAAVVTLVGCKDPEYKHVAVSSQGEVKSVVTVATVEPAPAPVVLEPAPAPIVAEPAFTEYIVQEGDFLSKISKRYNVTLAAIRRLNPSIKKDVIHVGQKIKLPGKIDVGVQKAPVKATKATKKAGATAYTGATKEYVVKSGDTLGSIAYGNGINIRQLKQLNGLTADALKVGQKLKIPAEKIVASAAKKADSAVVPAAETKKAETVVAPEVPAPAVETKKAESAVVPAAEAKKADAPATATYVVQEGDDMTGVSIRWGVSAAEIRELNNLGESDQLVPGQIIKLPAEAQQ